MNYRGGFEAGEDRITEAMVISISDTNIIRVFFICKYPHRIFTEEWADVPKKPVKSY